jgi:hypothetical protein
MMRNDADLTLAALRTEAKSKKLSIKDKVSRKATACTGKCKATLSHMYKKKFI